LQLQTQDYNRLAGDDVRILRWLYPTSVWKAGDRVPDVHTLQISEALPPGAYRLVAGLYPYAAPDERLPAFTAAGNQIGDSLTIGWVKVPQEEIPVPGDNTLALDAALGDSFALRNASLSRLEDGKIQIMLYWESLAERPAIDATLFVHVVDADGGQNVAQQDARPWGGQYPTFIWSKGEIVKTDYILDIGDLAPDTLAVMVGMYTFPELERLPVTQDGETSTDSRVNLGNLGELLGALYTP